MNSSPSVSTVLLKRVIITLLLLLIYRFGTYVPLPVVDYKELLKGSSNAPGILSTLNTFSGGALSRMAIFSLNVMPYIIASVVLQLLSSMSNNKDNEGNENKTNDKNKHVRWVTLLFAFLQAFVVVLTFLKNQTLFLPHTYFLFAVSVLTLVTGAMLLMWIGDLITMFGIGSGISLIIFSGIVAELPSSFLTTLNLVRKGAMLSSSLFLGFVVLSIMILLVVFVEYSFRNITVHYPRRSTGQSILPKESSYIPLKINMAGVIPPIFANAVLVLPMVAVNLFHLDEMHGVYRLVSMIMLPGSLLYSSIYATLIIFFALFYTNLVFNPNEIADNLKKSGGIILGKRPGADTAAYLKKIVSLLTFCGAIYVAALCLVSDLLRSNVLLSFSLGGTSLLIVVGVITDTGRQLQMHMFANQYKKLVKKSGLRKRMI